MRRAEKMRRGCTRSHNRAFSEEHVATNVAGRFEMQLSVEVSVISNLMTFVHRAVNELGPSFRVPAENEEGRFDAVFGERVENAWSRIGIRTVVESQGDFLFFGRQVTHHRAENKTVSVECAV